MTEVIFKKYNFRKKTKHGKEFIFDLVRKKFVALTPEEWVRQHILHFLVFDKGYPKSLIAVERGIDLNGLQKRFDIVVFDKIGKPKLMIECKASEEQLDEKVFAQIARYNLSLQVDYLWVTNGQQNFCCKLKDGIQLLSEIPAYENLLI